MNMHTFDWTIMAGLMALLLVTVLGTRKYMQGVSDFLAAGRCGGRYLLCIGEGIAGTGAITIVAFWQMYYVGGFTSIWWTLPQWPLLFIVAMSGWVLYRFRQTRALTMAQFLEMRYSRSFRIYTGSIAFLSGVINYGVFPGINAQFFIYFCGLPESFELVGLTLRTFPVVMACLLGFALYLTFTGGQIAILLANFLQGAFCMIVLLSCSLVLVHQIGWTNVTEALATAPEGKSWINPFDISETRGFDPRFFMIQYFIIVYVWKAWMGTQGYNTSAKTPHEARMSQILGSWRYFSQEMLLPIFAIAAIVVLHHADFSSIADSVNTTVAGFPTTEQRSQMVVPIVLSKLLPIGLMGGLAAVMLAAAVSTDQSYLHSWGSIFIQDVLMPFRKKPFIPKMHVWALRISIFAVALFAFVFSLFFTLPDFIRMFFALTGAIYLGGAGACILGGLYTRFGTAAAAWTTMTSGAILGVGGIVLQQIQAADQEIGGLMAWLQFYLYKAGPIEWFIGYFGSMDGQRLTFFNAICCIAIYLLVSLVTYRKAFNLDRMLHRGAYALEEDIAEGDVPRGPRIHRWLGINESFTRSDRIIYLSSVSWTLLLGVVFFVGLFWHWWSGGIPDSSWLVFWGIVIAVGLALGMVFTVWFVIGGIMNVKEMFHLLATRVRDAADDGVVRDDYGQEEAEAIAVPTPIEADETLEP